MGLLQQMMNNNAQAPADTHNMLGGVFLHARADTADKRVRQLAEAADERINHLGGARMDGSEMSGQPDHKTAEPGQRIYAEQENTNSKMEEKQVAQVSLQ